MKATDLRKPRGLGSDASDAWDEILSIMFANELEVQPGHAILIGNIATASANIIEAQAEITKAGGAYFETRNGWQLHPAARRLDGLRRDIATWFKLLGVTAPEKPEPKPVALDPMAVLMGTRGKK